MDEMYLSIKNELAREYIGDIISCLVDCGDPLEIRVSGDTIELGVKDRIYIC